MSAEAGLRLATAAVLEVKCAPMPPGSIPVKGYDFNEGVDYEKLLQSYSQMGIQARNFGLAVDEINRMVSFALVGAFAAALNPS
jgi:deoxyhypusine synthase